MSFCPPWQLHTSKISIDRKSIIILENIRLYQAIILLSYKNYDLHYEAAPIFHITVPTILTTFQSLHQGIFDVLDVNEAAADEAVGTTPVMTPGLDKCKRLHQGVKGIRYLQFYGKHINAEFKVERLTGPNVQQMMQLL